MRLEGERWRTLVSTVRLGRDEYRVVRPARPITHAPLYLSGRGVQVIVDKAAALTLAMAWEFALRSPRTLVYLPLRHNQCACRGYGDGDEALHDLVLMHHSLGFPASRWKEVRARLGNGQPHTVVSRKLPEVNAARYENRKDVLRHDIAADTVFLSGSRKAFAAEGEALRMLVEDCPRHMHENLGTHCCAEITVDRMWEWLHVVYCDEHRVHATG
jgi:hypothetical protein